MHVFWVKVLTHSHVERSQVGFWFGTYLLYNVVAYDVIEKFSLSLLFFLSFSPPPLLFKLPSVSEEVYTTLISLD